MYQTPALDLPPRRLPIIAAAFVIACLCFGATQALISATDDVPLRLLIIPPAAIAITYAILAAYLEASGAYEKDPALGGLAFIVCPIISGALAAGLLLAAQLNRYDHYQPILAPPTLRNRLALLILNHFSLFAILPWLAGLAIALFCGLRRRQAQPPAIAHGLADQLGPAPGDEAA
ncbi:MAG TPA: hypothetical protein VGE07_18095 [Herpetosiphonaceae bacterium]